MDMTTDGGATRDGVITDGQAAPEIMTMVTGTGTALVAGVLSTDQN
jgi:hypothetical protein